MSIRHEHQRAHYRIEVDRDAELELRALDQPEQPEPLDDVLWPGEIDPDDAIAPITMILSIAAIAIFLGVILL